MIHYPFVNVNRQVNDNRHQCAVIREAAPKDKLVRCLMFERSQFVRNSYIFKKFRHNPR